MEAKLLIFYILTKFTIEICDKTPEKIEFKSPFGFFELRNDIFVELKRRSIMN